MAKITLTIDPSYCASWSFWEGARELIQNAKDAEEYDYRKMTITHHPRTNKLVITTADTTVPAATLLLLGSTSKGDGGQRGKFGEGFALGTLALVRAGHPVTIYNGEEVWRPEITQPDEDHTFAGSDLLVFNTRRLMTPRTDFTVEIENVSKDVWKATKKLFLFLAPPKEAVTLPTGRVLLDEQYKGQVFVKGIFVTKHDQFECGYDLCSEVTLDRDRKIIEEWSLQYRLSELWTDAHTEDPEAFAPKVYQMAKEGRSEVKQLRYRADKKLLDAMRKEFEAEHGSGAVAVTTMADSREVDRLGGKGVVVDSALAELLDKTGPNLAATKANLAGSIKTTVSWGELTADEADACTRVERVTKDYQIVEFHDEEVLGRHQAGDRQVAIARLLLAKPERDVLRHVARYESSRRGVTIEEVLLDVILQ